MGLIKTKSFVYYCMSTITQVKHNTTKFWPNTYFFRKINSKLLIGNENLKGFSLASLGFVLLDPRLYYYYTRGKVL